MPKVVCEEHGENIGIAFCCNHLASAVIGNGHDVRYRIIATYDDESGPRYALREYICFDCLKKYNLTKSKYDWDDPRGYEDGTWPRIIPVCSDCFKEYEEKKGNILNP